MKRTVRYVVAAALLLLAVVGLPVVFPGKSSPDTTRATDGIEETLE